MNNSVFFLFMFAAILWEIINLVLCFINIVNFRRHRNGFVFIVDIIMIPMIIFTFTYFKNIDPSLLLFTGSGYSSNAMNFTNFLPASDDTMSVILGLLTGISFILNSMVFPFTKNILKNNGKNHN